MRWHIRILAALHLAVGVGAGCLLAAARPSSEFSGALGPALSTLAAIFALVALSLTALMITSGIGLLRLRRWGRTLSIVTSMALLPAIPIGAAASLYPSPLPALRIGAAIGVLGLYGLWVLLNSKTQRLFPPQSEPV